ncbi:MAG: putative RNA methyltransferase [Propionibacteriaceae bacterium]
MIDQFLDLLRCPGCQADLEDCGRQVGCINGHRFDVARQGYLNLLTHRQPAHADTASMVAARADFLARGHFAPLLAALPLSAQAKVIIDAGAGPGSYLAGALDRRPQARGVALDVSVPACRRAARAHSRLAAVVADTWSGLPVRSRTADAVLVIFAPRNFGEFARVLKPDGRLLVVTPAPDHLGELRDRFALINVDQDKVDRLSGASAGRFSTVDRTGLRYPLTLGAGDLADVILMGPNAFHAPASTVRSQAAASAPVDVTCSFTITELAPRH